MCAGEVTLDSCRIWAQRNYPAIRQYELISKSEKYNVSNAARSWIPQVAFSAQALYYSDQANMSEVWEALGLTDMFKTLGKNIPDLYLRKFQGKVQLDVQQTLWDGGMSVAGKRTAQADARQQKAQADVDFDQLESRVDNIYFGILLLDLQQEQLAQTDSLLQKNMERMRTLYNNDVILQSDLDAMEVEILTLGQKIDAVSYSRDAYRRMLCLITGRNLMEDTLQVPEELADYARGEQRAELRLMDAKIDYLMAQEKRIKSYSMPQFYAFAQGWYGYPKLNMFDSMQSSEWGLSAVVGVRMQWNIGAYYTQGNRLKTLRVNQEQVRVQKDIFEWNLQMHTAQEDAEITRLKRALEDDNRIVELRRSVRSAAEVKHDNGTITTTELLQKITDESMAVSAQSAHKIELLKTQYELNKLK
ncbi:MAG: TolC family protein [Paludibacteraceae bacterium]|nr:TolC family protein [Paludibacteraceae bacterium]